MDMPQKLNTNVFKFRSSLHGQMVLPGDGEYETARRIWNGAIDRHPAMIVRCADVNDVQRAVEFGRQSNLEIAVRGGGHSFPGYSTCDGGLVIDLSPMKSVQVNFKDRLVSAQAGLTLGKLVEAIQVYGLGVNTGTMSETGIAGLTLGGGVGLLAGKFGLTCDSVSSFEIVTAEGDLLRANTIENPDLYWGLKGGGGNFGIVTEFEYQLQPLGKILGGLVTYPLAHARSVLEFYRDFCSTLPDELTVVVAMITSPEKIPLIAIGVCYCGDLEEGERVLTPLRKFGAPLVDGIKPMPFAGLFVPIDPTLPAGRCYYVKGSSLPELSSGAIEALVDSAEGMTSPYSQIFMAVVHGAATRVGQTETAFPLREPHFEITYDAAWIDNGQERHVQWVRQSYQQLEQYSTERAYVNFLAEEATPRIRAAYGPNYQRLVSLKNKYDPKNIFHLNQNIKPNTSLSPAE